MAVNYEIDTEARIVRLGYVGESTVFDFVTTLAAIFRTPGYQPGFGFLSDRRNATAPETEYVGRTFAFVHAHQDQMAGARWATVVSSPENRGLAQMAQTILESNKEPLVLKVFTDIQEAERWLRETAPKT